MLNKPLARKLLVLVILGQLAVLLVMAGKREWIYFKGEEIYLRTAPLDPRDPFRGDFVRLCYAINTVHQNHAHGDFIVEELQRDQVVYTALRAGANNVYELDHLSLEPPEDSLFVKGRYTRNWKFRCGTWNPHSASLKYGIEQYFVQQGKGKEMEARLGTREGLQIPLEVQLAIGKDGTAVIKGHRWSQIGLQFELLRTAPFRQSEDEPVISPLVKLTFENVSEQTLFLYNPGNNCSFSLILDNENDYRERADAGCAPEDFADTRLIPLAPGEQYAVSMDFSDPRWHIEHEGQRVESGALSLRGWNQFQLRYHARPVEGAWTGPLTSPRFDATGRID